MLKSRLVRTTIMCYTDGSTISNSVSQERDSRHCPSKLHWPGKLGKLVLVHWALSAHAPSAAVQSGVLGGTQNPEGGSEPVFGARQRLAPQHRLPVPISGGWLQPASHAAYFSNQTNTVASFCRPCLHLQHCFKHKLQPHDTRSGLSLDYMRPRRSK